MSPECYKIILKIQPAMKILIAAYLNPLQFCSLVLFLLYFSPLLFSMFPHFFLSNFFLLAAGYTTPTPAPYPQQGGGSLSPRSGLQPPGGFSSLGAAGTDPASSDKKKASQQTYQEELKRQVKT